MGDEQCPSCGALFPAERAWLNRGMANYMWLGALQDLDTRVRCPNCRHIFDATEFRFIGFVPPRAFRGLVLCIALVVLVGGAYTLLKTA